MSTYIEQEGQDVVLIPMSPTRMDAQEADDFYSTLEALATYANGLLHVVREQPLRLRGDSRAELDETSRVLERLWINRWIVRRFVEKNPAGLPGRCLEMALPWEHAFRDVFVVADACPWHVLLVNDDRAIAYGEGVGQANALVREVPSRVLLTLLPYKKGIVTDTRMMRLADEDDAIDLAEFVPKANALIQRGVLASAEELIEYSDSRAWNNYVLEPWQEKIDACLGLPHVTGRPLAAR